MALSILTQGFGSFGSVYNIPRLGFPQLDLNIIRRRPNIAAAINSYTAAGQVMEYSKTGKVNNYDLTIESELENE